jgi:hypothetical protein
VGVTGDGIQTEITDVTFPVLTTTNEFYVIDTTNSQPGSTLFVDKTKDNIISLVILLKAGFKVDFVVGRDDDSCFGGSLYTSQGILIQMGFHDNLWHIPMWSPPSIIQPRLGPALQMSNYYRDLDTNSRDKCVSKTITDIIASLHAEGHQGPVEQGFIGNRLHGTDVSEFIHARYDSLVKFLQDGNCLDDFVVTIANKGTCFIAHAPELVLPRPVRVSPADSMTLDSGSAALMHLSLSRWGFPCPVRHLQIYHKYKRISGRCYRVIVTPLLGCLSEREDIVPHSVLKYTVVRNRGSHLLVVMRHALLRYLRRIKTCLKSYER